MHLTRKQKEKRRADNQRRRSVKLRKRVTNLLAILGLRDGFQKLPDQVQKAFWEKELACVRVLIDDNVAKLAEAKTIKKDLTDTIAECNISVGSIHSLSVVDFLCILPALPNLFDRVAQAPDPALSTWGQQAKACAINFCERYKDDAHRILQTATEVVLCRWSNLASKIFYCSVEFQPRDGKLVFGICVKVGHAEQVKVAIDDKMRPVYRCGGAGLDSIAWVTWHSSHLGITEEEKLYPVFVQGHALRRLRDRLTTNPFGDVLLFCLCSSLWKRRIAKSSDPIYLVEYWLGESKVGYLVCERLADMVLVKTFLFLTMAETPEGKLLQEKLQLCRRDVEHLQLDKLDSFLKTDISDDPKVANLLRECGCGHLLDLAKTVTPQNVINFAAELRKFLGLEGAGINSLHTPAVSKDSA